MSEKLARAAARQQAAAKFTFGSLLETPNQLAKRLNETRTWSGYRKRVKESKAHSGGDPHRINITSEKLCGRLVFCPLSPLTLLMGMPTDDILGRIGPGLERHVGCDLIDINPGAGLWSTKLHDLLKPRKHILLEPDDALYEPFLRPLLSRENVVLVPKSGLVWDSVGEILTPEFLPHQKLHDWRKPAERNDTLLVTGNLVFHPEKRFKNFANVATLVIYQLICSIRAGNMFQKYGRVRLLLWVDGDEKERIMPHSILRRRRLAQDAELSLEWVIEVAGPDIFRTAQQAYMRDAAIDMSSVAATLERMRKSGTTIPPGRETALVMAHRRLEDSHFPQAGTQDPHFAFPYLDEIRQYDERIARGEVVDNLREVKRYRKLLHRQVNEGRLTAYAMDMMRAHALIADMYAVNPELAAKADDMWNQDLRCKDKHQRLWYLRMRDDLHIWYQDPPVLMYDRRPHERLKVDPLEFFPNVPCSLMDIQPKAMNPLLHDLHPGLDPSLRARLAGKGGGAVIEILTRRLMQGQPRTLEEVLDRLSPGLARMITPHCPSLRDRRLGGSPVSGLGQPTVRTLNQLQMIEVVGAYVRSPHTPSHWELAEVEPVVSGMEDMTPDMELEELQLEKLTDEGSEEENDADHGQECS